MLLRYFRELISVLQPPSPSELGWSKDNALALREFTPYQSGKSWEDWHEHCRGHYPVRYFLSETLPQLIKRRAWWPVRRFTNMILDHCWPSRRHHVFDLRGIDPLSDYSHGYLDPCQVFYLAGWGSLLRWYAENGSADPSTAMSADEQLECQAQLESHVELRALVHYWTVTRVERDRCNMQLYNALEAIPITAANRDLYEATQERWLAHCRESESLEEEMWLRLAKMRSHLW